MVIAMNVRLMNVCKIVSMMVQKLNVFVIKKQYQIAIIVNSIIQANRMNVKNVKLDITWILGYANFANLLAKLAHLKASA